MNYIDSIKVRRFNLPLAEVLSDAKHGDHTHFELITVTVTSSEGIQGTGYTYTGGKGGRAIQAMLEADLTEGRISLAGDGRVSFSKQIPEVAHQALRNVIVDRL